MNPFKIEAYEFFLLAFGSIALLAATVPHILKNRPVTAPILYAVIGGILYFTGRNYEMVKVFNDLNVILHLSEFVVIVALTGAGLKIKRPFSISSWTFALPLLLVTMPLTILATAFLGQWALGLAPATALLFGALISPTDPVLAADIQTTQPSKSDHSRTRLALTAEAGFNDGLAFPFTILAVYLVNKGFDFSQWGMDWFIVDVIYKITVGCAIGLGLGWLLFKVIFGLTAREKHSGISRGILSLALTLLPYALTEMVGGYGFIAVFVAACAFGNSEQHAEYMDSLHDFSEEIEHIFVALIFVIIGLYVVAFYEDLARWDVILTAVGIVFVIRPISGWLALSGSGLTIFEKFFLSFYGIRGIGSIFYLTYGLKAAKFPRPIC